MDARGETADVGGVGLLEPCHAHFPDNSVTYTKETRERSGHKLGYFVLRL